MQAYLASMEQYLFWYCTKAKALEIFTAAIVLFFEKLTLQLLLSTPF